MHQEVSQSLLLLNSSVKAAKDAWKILEKDPDAKKDSPNCRVWRNCYGSSKRRACSFRTANKENDSDRVDL